MKNINLSASLLFLLLIIAYGLPTSCTTDKLPEPSPNLFCDTLIVTYDNHIQPIIDANCAIPDCHNAGSTVGDMTDFLNLSNYLNKNQFERRVLEIRDMPIGDPLPTADYELIQCWVNGGYLEN